MVSVFDKWNSVFDGLEKFIPERVRFGNQWKRGVSGDGHVIILLEV